VSRQFILNLGKRGLTYLLIVIFAIVLLVGLSLPFARSIKPDGLLYVNNLQPIAIDNVNLVTMTESGILKNRQLIIESGRIADIRPAGSSLDASIQVFDANQGYLTPGLFDMHVHLYDRSYLMANLAFGVTSVRALRGDAKILSWKNELARNEWLGSNLYVSSPILDGEHAHLMNQRTLTPEQGRHQVRLAKEKGYDFIKAYGYLNPAVFEAIIDEAEKIQIPVAKHGPHPIDKTSWQSLEQLQTMEHVEDIFQGPLDFNFDHVKLKQVVAQIKQINVPVTPTLTTFYHLTQLSLHKQTFIDTLNLDYLNPFYRDLLKEFSVNRWLAASDKHAAYNQKEFQFLQDIVAELNAQQVTLLVGSDAGTMFTLPGISTHDELMLMSQAGLTNLELLEAATVNAATALQVQEHYGSIQVGLVADLILLSTNPLDDIKILRTPVAVIKNGQWLSQHDLESLERSAKQHTSYYWSFIGFLDDIIERAFD